MILSNGPDRALSSKTGIATIIVTHEMRFAKEVFNTCHFFDAGRIVDSGKTLELLNQPQTPRLKTFLSSLRDI